MLERTFKSKRTTRNPVSPDLYNAVLDNIFGRLKQSENGSKIDGKKLNHTKFADNEEMILRTPDEAESMQTESYRLQKVKKWTCSAHL